LLTKTGYKSGGSQILCKGCAIPFCSGSLRLSHYLGLGVAVTQLNKCDDQRSPLQARLEIDFDLEVMGREIRVICG